MRLLEYNIKSQVFIKAEITKLTAYPIKNDSNNYYVVIPILKTDLPNNIMFLNDTIIVDPHSTYNYVPKFIKMGVTLSQSMATALPNGVSIRLLIIDNIEDMSIDNVQHITVHNKNTIENNNKNNNSNQTSSYITDNTVIKTDSNTMDILMTIDSKLNNKYNSNNVFKDNTTIPNVNEVEIKKNDKIIAPKKNIPLDSDGNPIKRGRGRPRKYPLPTEAQKISNDVLNELNQTESTQN